MIKRMFSPLNSDMTVVEAEGVVWRGVVARPFFLEAAAPEFLVEGIRKFYGGKNKVVRG
jgi:hypothetical protein